MTLRAATVLTSPVRSVCLVVGSLIRSQSTFGLWRVCFPPFSLGPTGDCSAEVQRKVTHKKNWAKITRQQTLRNCGRSKLEIVSKTIKVSKIGGFAPRLKDQKTTQNGCCRAGVVPNPEFTPRNTTTGVFEFWRLAGPKETRSGILYSPYRQSPRGPFREGLSLQVGESCGYAGRCPCPRCSCRCS